MREFNTTGPCNPALHYTIMREALLAVGQEKVDKGKFFTIFAPRQSGKTTYCQLLLHQLNQVDYTAVWISFESLQTATRSEFYDDFGHQIQRELVAHDFNLTQPINTPIDLRRFFEAIKPKPLVLIIDEFEGIPDAVLGEVMHTFRQMYHQKQHYNLHSLIVVGVSTIAELVMGPVSPFNIADQLEIDYFTQAEVAELIQQYVSETGQPFDETVIKTIYENTQGQPGLVCALCEHLVTKVVTEQSHPVTMEAFYPTLKFFLTRKRDKNIANIVQKAKQKRAFMLKLLFGNPLIPFTVDNDDISWLHANGVVDGIDGYVKTEGLSEGSYVVFSNVHTETDTLYFAPNLSDPVRWACRRN